MRRFLALVSTVMLVSCMVAPASMAARNPAGRGQPGTFTEAGAACGTEPSITEPHGFETAGFKHAGEVYAGSPGTPSEKNGSPHALSEYDIACYQVSQPH